jgi:hypothetical protein
MAFSIGLLPDFNGTGFQTGTVLTPAFLNNLCGNVNGWIQGTGPTVKSFEIDGVGANSSTVAAGSLRVSGSIISGDRAQLFDTFCGQSLSTGNWTTATGTVSIVDDSANAANGAVKVDATAGGVHNFETRPLGLPGDFLLRGRFRVTGVTASSSIGFGCRTVADTAFLIDGSQSTTNWRVLVNGASTAANGTPVAINATYSEFEMQRTGNTITFKINGTLLHTATSPTLTGATIRSSANGAGILWGDWISFFTVYGA